MTGLRRRLQKARKASAGPGGNGSSTCGSVGTVPIQTIQTRWVITATPWQQTNSRWSYGEHHVELYIMGQRTRNRSRKNNTHSTRVVIVRPLELSVFICSVLPRKARASFRIREFELQLKYSPDAIGRPLSTSKVHRGRLHPHQTTPRTPPVISGA